MKGFIQYRIGFWLMAALCAVTPAIVLSQQKLTEEQITDLRLRYFASDRKAMEFLHVDPDSAIYYENQALSYGIQLRDYAVVMEGLMFNANVHRLTGDYSKVIEYLLKTAEIAEKLNRTSDLAYAYIEIGNTYYSLNMARQAIYFYQQSLRVFIENENAFGVGLCLNNLGMCYEVLGVESHDEKLIKQAFVFYYYGYRVRRPLRDPVLLAQSMNYLGDIELLLHHEQRALAYYKESLRLLRWKSKDDPYYLLEGMDANIWMNIGRLYTQLQDFHRASENFKIALNIARKEKLNYMVVRIYESYTDMLMAKGDLEEAIRIQKEIERISKSIGYNPEYLRAMRRLSELYKTTGKTDLHKYYLTEYYSLQEQLEGDDYMEKIGMISQLNAIHQKQEEVAQQEEVVIYLNRAKESERKRSLYFQIGLVLLTFFIAAVLYNFFRLRGLNRLLNSQNEKISSYAAQVSEANDLKRVLITVIGHDLRNLFQRIVGGARTIRAKVESGSGGEALPYAENLSASTEQAIHLFENLLIWTQLNEAHSSAKLSEVSLNDILTENLLLLNDQLKEKRLKVESAVPEMLVQGDFSLLSTVVRNLLFNAVANSPSDRVIRIGGEQRAVGEVSFWIRNDGVITEELKTWINSVAELKIETMRSSVKTKGLGLVICKKLLHANKGKLYARTHDQSVEIGAVLLGKVVGGNPADKVEINIPDRKEFEVGAEARNEIIAMCDELKLMKVYQASQIIKLLNTKFRTKDPGAIRWKEALERSVFGADQKEYDRLVNYKFEN